MTETDIPRLAPVRIRYPSIEAFRDSFRDQREQTQRYSVVDKALGVREQEQALMRTFNESVAIDPELAAEARRLGIETGLAPDVVTRNIDRVKLLAQQRQFRRAQLARVSPILARQFLDPEFARLAHDDLDNLSLLEGLVSGWNRGWLENELSVLHNRQAGGDTSPALQEQIDEIVRRLQSLPTAGGFRFGQLLSDPGDALMGIVSGGGRMAGMLAPSLRDAAPEAAIGMLLGSVIPGVGTVLGATIVGGGELARQFFIQERGASYAELRDLGVDHTTAAEVSFGVGAINASLEFVGLGLVTAPLRAGFKQLARGRFNDMVRDLTLGRAVQRLATGTLKSAGGEAITEMMQEVSNILGEEIALHSAGQENAFETETRRQSVVDRILEMGQEAFGSALLLGGVGAGVRFSADLQRIQQAETSQRFVQSLAEGTKNSKLSERATDMFQRFMSRLSRGQPVENFYFDAVRFDEALQQAGVSRETLKKILPEVEAQIDEAKATGGDVVIPTAEYGAKIARTQLHESLAQEARISPEHPSLRSVGIEKAIAERLATQAQATLSRQLKQADEFVQSARQVEENIREQIQATGQFRNEEVRSAASVFRNWVVVTAERLGKLPHEVAEMFPFQVFGAQAAAAAGLPAGTGVQQFEVTETEANEAALRELLKPPGEIKAVGPETGELNADGLSRLEDEHGSVRYLLSEGGEPVSVLQVVRNPARPQEAQIANVFTIPERRRQGLASQLFERALRDFPQLRHSPRLTAEGAAFATAVEQRRAEGLQQPVSTRLPRGLKAVENPELETLTVDYQVALRDTKTLTKNAATMRDLPFLRLEEGLSDEEVVEAYIQHVVDNLNWLFDQMPSELRERSGGWYDGGRRFVETWAERYGISDQQAAAIIAILSPQRDWFVNLTMAERILDIWFSQQAWTDEMTTRARKRTKRIPLPDGVKLKDVLGKKLSELDGAAAAYWVRVFDQAHNDPQFARLTPEGNDAGPARETIQWTSYSTIAKALSVLRDGRHENISSQLGSEHKVRSFYNNLLEPNSELQDVTIDTHAVAAAYLLPLAAKSRFVTQAWGGQGGATSRATGLNGFYPFLAEAYRRVGEQRGLLARQVQSVTWEQGRALFTPTRKRNVALLQEADAIWARYKAGDIEADAARSLMVETLGGFEALTWEGTEATEELAETYQGKARAELQPREAAADAAPRILVEAKPNTNPELLARWEELNDEQRASATSEILSRVTQLVATEFEVRADLQQVRGAWMGEPEAAMSVTLDRAENSVPLAGTLGELLHQEGMFVISPTRAQGLSAGSGLLITLPDGYTTEQVDQLYKDTLWPIEVKGKRPLVGHSTQGRHMVIGIDETEFGVTADDLKGVVAEQLDDTFQVQAHSVFTRFLVRGQDYARKDPTERPPAAGRSPVATRAARLVSEATSIYRAALDRVQGREPSLTQPEGGEAGRARGEFFPRQLVAVMQEGADFSTLMHEMSHFFFEVHERILAQPDPPKALIDDFDTFLQWAGVESLDAWRAMSFEQRRPHTEAFAFAFEVYLFEGKAPSTRMAKLFDKVRRFMVRVYTDILAVLNPTYREQFGRDLPVLTEEMRAVFGRMLAAEQEVVRTDAMRAFAPLFETQEQAGMTDEEWAGYLEALDEAREAAITDVTQASLKQMQWLSRARGKVLKALQRKHDKVRKQVEAEIEKEVRSRPVYRAIRYIRQGRVDLDDGGVVEVDGPHKLATEEVRTLLPKGSALSDLSGMTSAEGLDPNIVAELFGFTSGRELVEALVRAPTIEEEVASLTDVQMLQEHGELVFEDDIERAIQEALHNDARARFVAVELRFLQKVKQPVHLMTAAAKLAARRILGRKKMRDIRPSDFEAAERRAARAAEAAVKKGDTAAAIQAKHQELLQHHMAKEALRVRRDLIKAMRFFRQFNKTDKQLAKTRNVDYIGVGRAILAQHAMGPESTAAKPHLDQIKKHAPELLEDLTPLIQDAFANQMHWRDMPLDEFRVIEEILRALWFQSRRDRVIEVDGQKVERETIVEILLEALQPPAAERRGRTMTRGERRRVDFGSLLAWFKHVEAWAVARDGGEPGPIHQYLFSLLREPVNAYESERLSLARELHRRLNAHDFGSPRAEIYSHELDFRFKNKAELVGALRHAGNESNLRKLLLGHKMVDEPVKRGDPIDTSSWWEFIGRMINEGVLTKADFDLVQHIWNVYDTLLPRSQKAHFEIYGYRFEEIPKQPIPTPWGTYAGGYVPLKYDPHDARNRFSDDPLLSSSQEYQRAFPSTGRGFTFSRVEEFVDPLLLDVRMDAHVLDEHLRFIHLQRPGRDLLRLLRDPQVEEAMRRVDPNLIEEMFIPWIGTTLKNRVAAPGGPRQLTEFLKVLRRRSGLGIMFGNLTVGLQQITGIGNSLLFVDQKYLRGAAALYFRHLFSGKLTADVMERSEFMNLRLGKGLGQIRDDIDVMLKPSWVSRAEQWTLEHGYFMQRFFQQPVDVITWKGRYDQSIAQGREEQAVRDADTAVRRSQGSGQVADLSRFEKGHPLVRLLTQFSSFWMTTANAVLNRPTLRERIAAGSIAVLFAGLAAGAITQALRGGWEDEDDDGGLWDDITRWAFSETLQATAGVVAPSLGPNLLNPITGQFGGRITLGAGFGALERGISSPFRIAARALTDKAEVTGRDVKDLGTLLSLILGLPVTFITDRARFLIDAEDDEERARGAIVGR